MNSIKDGLESFPLEPGNPVIIKPPPDDDWMKAFPDERLTECVVIDHKLASPPPAPPVRARKRPLPERTLLLFRRHAMATSLVALTVMVAPVAILLGARSREGREAPVAVNALPQGETGALEPSAGRDLVEGGGLPADTLNVSGIVAREGKVSAPTPEPSEAPPIPSPVATGLKVKVAATVAPPVTLKPASVPTVTPTAASTVAVSPVPRPTPAATPTPAPTVIPAPTPIPALISTPAPTPSPTPTSTAVRAASASDLPAAAPAPTAREVETAAVKSVLDRYRQAFDTLSIDPVEAYWPSINARGLTRAFGQLDSQTVTFDSCNVDISRDQAAATCVGQATFTTKVGGRTPHVESRRWTFRLSRTGDRWMILSVESR